MSWQGVLLSTLLVLAGGPAIAKPSAPPPDPSTLCPPVVQAFLEAVGLLPELPDYARPIVLINVNGHPLDCLPRTLPAQEHAQAVSFLHKLTIFMARDQGGAPVCQVGEARLQDMSFISLIVSYDLARMNSPACLQRARQDLDVLQER